MRSTMTKAGLQQLRQKGLLPPEEELHARAPSNKEVFPEPRSNERVCFAEFLPRGFSLPLHDFVRGLMYAYVVQIHDFTPNGILHIPFLWFCASVSWECLPVGRFGNRFSKCATTAEVAVRSPSVAC